MSTSQSISTTIDFNELSHFKKISSTWWDELGSLKPLHTMNEVRVPLVRDGLINTGVVQKEPVDSAKPLKNILILEVGCGGGILSEALAKLGCTITGIDISPELIEIAKQHAALDASLSNLNYLLESVEEHAIGNYEKYDAVVTSEVLEHVVDPKLFLKFCVKCLKPGGSIFITTINKTIASWLGMIIFSEYIWDILPKGTHHWTKFITPKDTQRILEDNNCQLKASHGLFYKFWSNTWRWSSNRSINYALHATKAYYKRLSTQD